MQYKRSADIANDYKGCDMCTLSQYRQGEHVCVGHGSIPADIAIIIPRPLEQQDDLIVPFGSTDAGILFNKITEKAGIDKQRCMIIPTVACCVPDGESVKILQIMRCNERFMRMHRECSAKITVMMGPPSFYALIGADPGNQEFGWITPTLMYTPDILRYLVDKDADTAKMMMINWNEVAIRLKE